MIPLCPPTCLYLEVPLTSPSPAPRVEVRNLTPRFDVESTLTPYSTRLEAANQPPIGLECTLTSYSTQHPRSSHPVSQLLRPRQHLYLILHNQPAVLTSPPLCPLLRPLFRPSTKRQPAFLTSPPLPPLLRPLSRPGTERRPSPPPSRDPAPLRERSSRH